MNSNGDKFEGSFLNGLKHGFGKMKYKNGDICEGTWTNDKLSGDVTYVFANGNQYTG